MTRQFLKSDSVMFTLLPVMNIAPPLYETKLSLKLDLLTEVSFAERQIVPPLEWEVPRLIALLSTQVMLYILPKLPSQKIAPPSSPATLLSKVELSSSQYFPITYRAPPSLAALSPLKSDPMIEV